MNFLKPESFFDKFFFFLQTVRDLTAATVSCQIGWFQSELRFSRFNWFRCDLSSSIAFSFKKTIKSVDKTLA